MSKHYVWVHTTEVDGEGGFLRGVYTTLTRAKNFLGGEWTKEYDGAYQANISKYYDYDKLEKWEVQ